MIIDPIEEDPRVIEEREEEEAREALWTDFVQVLRTFRDEIGAWCDVSERVSNAHFRVELDPEAWDPEPIDHECVQFAETEGWHGVYTALGRAMREDEQAKRELVDRR